MDARKVIMNSSVSKELYHNPKAGINYENYFDFVLLRIQTGQIELIWTFDINLNASNQTQYILEIKFLTLQLFRRIIPLLSV